MNKKLAKTKKGMAFFFALAMLFGTVGCGANKEQGDSDDWEEVIGNPIPMDEDSKSIDDYLKEGYMTLEDMTQAIEQKFAKRQKDEVMNKIRHNSSFDYE